MADSPSSAPIDSRYVDSTDCASNQTDGPEVGAARGSGRHPEQDDGSLPADPAPSGGPATTRAATCPNCAALAAELDRVREMAALDIDNLETDGIIQRRQISKLKGELTSLRDKDTPPEEVEQLLEHWVSQRADALARLGRKKGRKPDIAKGDKRWDMAQRAIKRWGLDRCLAVIELGCTHPYWRYGERVADPPEPDATPYLGVEHMLREAKQLEKIEEIADRPAPTAADTAKAEADNLREFARKLPAPVRRPRGNIDTVLDTLTARGFAWRPTGPQKWVSQCPCHEDRTPSLGLIALEDGGVGAKCLGCQASAWDVCQVLGLDWSTFAKEKAA